jgi:hypothetical protein
MIRILCTSISVMLLFCLNAGAGQDIVGLWLFDEGEGDTVKDSSGNGNDGNINGCEWVDGRNGKALLLNGTTDFVSIPCAGTLLDFTGKEEGTCGAWIRFDEQVEQRTRCVLDNRQYYLQISGPSSGYDRDDAFMAGGQIGGQWHPFALSQTILEVGEWYYIVAVYDGKVNKAYVNGELEDTAERGGGYAANPSDVFLGKYSGGLFFAGVIDEVFIATSAWTDEEVKSMMNQFAPVSPSGNLVTTWAKIKSR